MMRKLYVDLGANVGDVAARFAQANPEFDIYCIEPNRELIPNILARSLQIGRPFFVLWAAAWTEDTILNLYQSTRHEAATVMAGKVEYEQYGWTQIDYSSPTQVPAINFGNWLRRVVNIGDEVVLKMDVEGAEYPILEAMIEDSSIDLVTLLRCEWHVDRYPSMPRVRHDNLLAALTGRVKMEPWG